MVFENTIIPEKYWIDPTCILVREGSISFTPNGFIDPKCLAVRHRWIILNKNYRITDGSSAVHRNEVSFVSEKDALERYTREKKKLD